MTDPNALLSVLIPGVTAVIGAFLAWIAKRGDRATQTLDMALKHLSEEVARQSARLTEQGKEKAELSRRVRCLEDRDRRREELVADFIEHTLANDSWIANGAVPPPPGKSLSIRRALRDAQLEYEDDGNV